MLKVGNKVRLSDKAMKIYVECFIDNFYSEERFITRVVKSKNNFTYYNINGFDGLFSQQHFCKDTFCKYME